MTNAEIARKIWEKAEWSYLQDLIVAALDAKDQLALGILEEVESLSKQLDAKDAEIAGWKRNWASDGRTIDSLWKQLAHSRASFEGLIEGYSELEKQLADAKREQEELITALHTEKTEYAEACVRLIADTRRATWEKAIQEVRAFMVYGDGRDQNPTYDRGWWDSLQKAEESMRRAMEEDCK
jgi:DNA repair exonuclease SbcCD ATPase subunit